MSNQNRIKAKIKPNGRVELRMERRDTFTLPRRTLERALADATIEAPWKELLRR